MICTEKRAAAFTSDVSVTNAGADIDCRSSVKSFPNSIENLHADQDVQVPVPEWLHLPRQVMHCLCFMSQVSTFTFT